MSTQPPFQERSNAPGEVLPYRVAFIREQADVLRLRQALVLAEGFQFHLVRCKTPPTGAALKQWLEVELTRGRAEPMELVRVSPYPADLTAHREPLTQERLVGTVLEPLLTPHGISVGATLVLVDATAAPPEDRDLWIWLFQRLNERRNLLIQRVKAPIVLELTPELEAEFINAAPDLWSVRGLAVVVREPLVWSHRLPERTQQGSIIDVSEDELLAARQRVASGSASDLWRLAVLLRRRAEKERSNGRLDEALRIYLQEVLPIYENFEFESKQVIIFDSLEHKMLELLSERAQILDNIADILEMKGELDRALQVRHEELLPISKHLSDLRGSAVIMTKVTDILVTLGQTDEALRILHKEALHVFEHHIDDMREHAVVLGRIADILELHGQMDIALRIRHDQELPIYERLGDMHARAITLSKIAKIFATQGQLDEALRIYYEEALPGHERSGDMRGRAITLARLADIHASQGQLDEALLIYIEEVLPTFEHLGDIQSRAVTLGKIAEIFAMRGQIDEALRIRLEEILPVFERFGNNLSRAHALVRVADILQMRGELDEALKIHREEVLPVYERVGDISSRATTLRRVARIFFIQGKSDEALQLCHQEVLPVFERLRDVARRARTQELVADILAARGQHEEALRLYQEDVLVVYERLGDLTSLIPAKHGLARVYLARGTPEDRAQARELLRTALESAEALHLREAQEIRATLQQVDSP